MAFSHFIHPEAEEDIRFILEYFISEVNLTVSLNFLDAIEDSANRLIQELDNNVRRSPKFDNIYAFPIKANKDRRNYAKDFSDYMLWYEIIDSKNQVIIWSIESIKRDPKRIIENLKNRKG